MNRRFEKLDFARSEGWPGGLSGRVYMYIIHIPAIKYALLDIDLWTKIRNATSTTTQVVYTTSK